VWHPPVLGRVGRTPLGCSDRNPKLAVDFNSRRYLPNVYFFGCMTSSSTKTVVNSDFFCWNGTGEGKGVPLPKIGGCHTYDPPNSPLAPLFRAFGTARNTSEHLGWFRQKGHRALVEKKKKL